MFGLSLGFVARREKHRSLILRELEKSFTSNRVTVLVTVSSPVSNYAFMG